ncbi:MAG: hypothetical protein AAFR18_11890 [Cyanobacteria bacterium J06627_32]
MVPDFARLRRQSCDRASLRSLKPSDHKGFDSLKSFQQFDTSHPNPPTSSQVGEIDHLFSQLWTACPSWSPILKKSNGWITIVNPSGKKVPLVLGAIESHYRRDYIIGKRFGRLTNYLMIDVDTGSPFHPANGGIQPILDAMESLGLCRYLLIRSSVSGGLHIYFPLAEPVSSWGIACAAHAALTAAGISIAGGICELFPNKKAFNAEHNGHRLPLQQGSFILDDDFRCIGNNKAVFLQQWQHCGAGQDDELLADVLAEKPLPIPKRISVSSLPPIAWTGPGQSNEVMKELVNFGDRYLGLKTIPALGDWIVTVAPHLPGFEQFASNESKNDLTRKNWAYRWAKSHFKSARQYAAKTSFDHNAMIAAEALERLMVALSKVVIVGKFGIKKLWYALSDISKELFGVGFSWGLFQKHRKLIMARIESSRNVGLSSGDEDGKNSASPELAESLDSEAGEESEKHLTELSTAKCVTASNSQDLNASRTPSEQGVMEEAGGQQVGAELAMGAMVKVQQPGSDVDGVQTRVTGKATDVDGKLLYRLEHCVEGQPLMLPGDCLEVVAAEASAQGAEGVIRATAAQLLKVLGKACPFVGPGLWAVKREEVSPLSWRQLRRLVGEG